MNLTIWSEYHEATNDADEYSRETGVEHMVIELLSFERAQFAIDLDLDGLLPDHMYGKTQYTVLTEAEYKCLAEARDDLEIQYVSQLPVAV